MINNTTLVGRLTKNPELKYTGTGIAVVSFSLAVERAFKNAQGERETDFINCVAWRQSAEALANFAVKGSLIGVTGNIQTRQYQNNAGQTVYVTEVVCDNFQTLESKDMTDKRRADAGGNNPAQGAYNNQGNASGYQGNQNATTAKNSPNNSAFDNNSQYTNNTNPFQQPVSNDGYPFAD